MRALLALLALVVAGCGQTGSLYLPEESIESPVEIRKAPSDEDEKDDKPAEPPGG
jgi:predicted small lipoprotein YifL